MPKTLRDKKTGQYAGSIGAGKTNIPTPTLPKPAPHTYNEATLPKYSNPDEQEFFEKLRKHHKTLAYGGNEFAITPVGKSSLYCFDCYKFLSKKTLAKKKNARITCPGCGAPIDIGLAGIGIQQDALKFLDPQQVLSNKWYHVSTNPNWGTQLQGLPDEQTPLVHLGTLEAAQDRGFDIVYHSIGELAKDPNKPVYLYEIQLGQTTPVSPYLMEEDAYERGPQTAADQNKKGSQKYAVNGVTRYLNHFEAPGSISLLANPKKFKVTNRTVYRKP